MREVMAQPGQCSRGYNAFTLFSKSTKEVLGVQEA